MIVCKVIGQAVSTLKDERLDKHRMLIVGRIGDDPDEILDRLVAVDLVGAGEGMLVGVVQGRPAQRALGDADVPVDAVIAAIFDEIKIGGKSVHQK